MVTAVETALERQLSAQIMSAGVKPRISKLATGDVLVRQGEPGRDVFLILDGVLLVEKDGERLAEYGPGALLGERAHLEQGGRTSSLIAVTRCRVAAVEATAIDRTRPAVGAVTGTSIFMDSRIISTSSAATSAPSATSIFQTMASISDFTSTGSPPPRAACRRAASAPAWSRSPRGSCGYSRR